MNILLQHWAGDLNEVVERSSANMRRYAESVGAEYRLIRGYPLGEHLNPPMQKLVMLTEEFDAYDVVVMVDADMFVPVGMAEDVFSPDLCGVGWHHEPARERMRHKHPEMEWADAPFWGGAIYRLSRSLREDLRYEGDVDMWDRYNSRGRGEDEGIMHLLAHRARVPVDGAYLPFRWCYPNFGPEVDSAAMIHMRHTCGRDRAGHPADGRTKLDNYYHLKARGILA